jgi:4-amino-4-deoxy-L-arabinose transferase-like glycosyltransferase
MTNPIPNTQYPIPNTKRQIRHWTLIVSLLLLTWGLRLCCLDTVPPGWRDDELINIHALSGQVLAGRFPLYFTGASGHEPLYHYVHAGVHALLGFNVLSGHLLSVACGTLAVALVYALARRLFGRTTAAVASLALATSFWSLMYSRTALRHISLPPFALAAFYLLWRSLTDKSPVSSPKSRIGHWSLVIGHSILLGLVVGISLYTYTAARLLPVVLLLFAAYLALFHRDQFVRHWRGLLLAFAVAAVLAAPLGVAIAQGRSEAAAQGIGADARLAELALPLRELQVGNLRPLLETTWTTLGMFHVTGDPEWLYNISGRPVFNLLGGALLWAGVALCLYRWRQPRYFFLLLWLGLGLLPAFVSIPPASLSHTILAQPVAYILPALALAEARRWLRSRNLQPTIRSSLLVICHLSFVVFLTTHATRDLRDYFVTWPERGMVRFLYRADYREAAHYLDIHPETTDVAVSSALMGPWDRLALEVDTHRDDVAVRLFSPERALVWVGDDAPVVVLLPSSARPASPIDGLLEASGDPLESDSPHLALYRLQRDPLPIVDASRARFANGLELTATRWLDEEPPAPGREAVLLTNWLVARPLRLPPEPVVANPPPPGVYSGPRLAVFTHLLAADGTFLVGDDGLWVDPLTLQPGDRFIQVHRFALSPDAPVGPYVLEIGMYDPMTGDRWPILDADGQPGLDRRLIPVEEGLR